MRTFESGATRDDDTNKLHIEGYINPLAFQVYCEYMKHHQTQADGTIRAADNWQKGISKKVYIDCGMRHMLDWWLEHRGYTSREGLRAALCAVIFNAFGYLLEDLKEERAAAVAATKQKAPAQDEPEREPLTGLYQTKLELAG